MYKTVKGASGRAYQIVKALQDKNIPHGRVYLATHGQAKVVLKEIPQDFRIRLGIYDRLGSRVNVRTPIDQIPDLRMFVFQHLDQNLLHFAQRNLSLSQTKKMLHDALQGLAALHECDLVHTDVKPNNIMMRTTEHADDVIIDLVQLVDLEDTAHVPPGRAIKGAQVGNWMWRSPEAHAEGPVETPSDMFSFGLVCIYALTRKVILAVDESALADGEDKLAVVLERQISYFADEDGFSGLMHYIGRDSPWCEIFEVIKAGFGADQPRKPFALWHGEKLDEDFKDLISGLTYFDPLKRLTADQALSHRWLREAPTA